MVKCISCKKDLAEIPNNEQIGIKIENFCLDNLPEKIFVCSDCTIQAAVNILSGKLPNFSILGGFMKGILK